MPNGAMFDVMQWALNKMFNGVELTWRKHDHVGPVFEREAATLVAADRFLKMSGFWRKAPCYMFYLLHLIT